jgi:hypothetical protein
MSFSLAGRLGGAELLNNEARLSLTGLYKIQNYHKAFLD